MADREVAAAEAALRGAIDARVGQWEAVPQLFDGFQNGSAHVADVNEPGYSNERVGNSVTATHLSFI